jgi:hypothetical protein
VGEGRGEGRERTSNRPWDDPEKAIKVGDGGTGRVIGLGIDGRRGLGPGKGRPTTRSRTGWPFVFLDHFQPRPDRVGRFWIVQTRDCPQEMGTDPWPCLKVLHFDARRT